MTTQSEMTSSRLVALLATLVTFAALAGGADSTGPCFGSLGCFPASAPWTSLLRPAHAPWTPEAIGTAFFLYTRNSPERFYVDHPRDGEFSVQGSDFDGSKLTVFVIHGLVELGQEQLMDSLKDALLAKVDANVVQVYWAQGAVTEYMQMTANARVVGAVTAQFVQFLATAHGSSPARTHLIGWGPGAHVAGYVAKVVTGVSRITALDPSRRAFEGFDRRVRLDIADAVFVDVVHTDAGAQGLGAARPLGHVDVYVNGGWDQEGCAAKLVPAFFTGTYDIPGSIQHAVTKFTRCRQERAVELFAASLSNANCTFWAHKGSSIDRALSAASGGATPRWLGMPCSESACSPLGFDSALYPARGVFDVTTARSTPFCQPDPAADAAMLPFSAA